MNKNIYNLMSTNFRPFEEKTLPIAEEIVKLLEKKKISYAEACEALDIAKEGIQTLTIG